VTYNPLWIDALPGCHRSDHVAQVCRVIDGRREDVPARVGGVPEAVADRIDRAVGMDVEKATLIGQGRSVGDMILRWRRKRCNHEASRPAALACPNIARRNVNAHGPVTTDGHDARPAIPAPIRRSALESAASTQWVKAGQPIAVEIVLLTHRSFGEPSNFVVGLIVQLTLPVLTRLLTHGCTCNAGFLPQVDCA